MCKDCCETHQQAHMFLEIFLGLGGLLSDPACGQRPVVDTRKYNSLWGQDGRIGLVFLQDIQVDR